MVDLKEIQKEIDEMGKSLEDQPFGEDQGTDPPGTDSPGTDSPSTDSPSTDSPSTDAPTTEAPAEDPRDAELRAMREEIEELKKSRSPSTESPSTEAPQTEVPIGDEDFLGDIDLDDLTRDKELFNKVLNEVHRKGIAVGRSYTRETGERLIRSVPDIVKNSAAVQAQLDEVNKKFYDENKDLVPWKKSVAVVFEEMISDNPDRHYNEILPEVATEVRKRIGLQKRADNKDDNPPKLPRKKGGQRQTSKPELSDIEAEMEEMDRALEL
uniref:Uncharacterized protein n=1 Tax=viral metagenome TaxID=1070528 RepID=A0A6H1ZXQ9_9ZZZZ